MLSRLRLRKNGPRAAVIVGGYVLLVLALGILSVIILLTVQDPILVTGVFLMLVTVPLGPIIWFSWDVLPIDGTAGGVSLIGAICLAGLVQAWLLWLALRGPVQGAAGPG
ncbi:SCO4225 family membrane protein [Streptosporangium sp. KLBMP 9127]|nr:hypothetical protein [Streptosporangium sp. KLBMP 9127]